MVFTNFLCYFSIWFTWLLLFLRIFLNDIAVKSKRKLPNYLIGELLFRKFTRLLFSVPDTVDGVGSSVRLFFFSLHETRYAEFYRVLPNSITTPTTTTSFWQQSCRIQVDQNDRVGNYRSTWQWWSSCPFYFISFAPCSPESGRGLRHLIGFTRVLFTLTFYCVSFVVVLHRSFTGFLPGCVTRLLYILTGWSWNGTWTFFGPPFFLLRISMHVGECVSEEDVALHKRSSRPSRTFVFPLVFFSFVSFHFVQTVFRFVLANRFTALACWDNTHTHTCWILDGCSRQIIITDFLFVCSISLFWCVSTAPLFLFWCPSSSADLIITNLLLLLPWPVLFQLTGAQRIRLLPKQLRRSPT